MTTHEMWNATNFRFNNCSDFLLGIIDLGYFNIKD